MAIEKILWAIEEQAEEEANRIVAEVIAEAEAAAEEIVATARAHGQEVMERYYRQRLLPELRAEEARLIGEARRDSLELVMRAKEELVDQAFSVAMEELSRIRSREDYPDILRRLTQEVVDELGSDLVIEVSPEDSELMEKMAAEMGLNAIVRPSLECMGGLAATPRDGRILLVNTFDSRLERAREVLRAQVAVTIAGTD